MITLLQIISAWFYYVAGMYAYLAIKGEKPFWICLVTGAIAGVFMHLQQKRIEKKVVSDISTNDKQKD